MTNRTLIIDDDPIVIIMLKKLIQLTDFDEEPLTFSNGAEAITYLRENYNQKNVFSIFLDINMPVMNGWEFLIELTNLANPANTFVCIVTSSTDRYDELKASQHPLVSKFLIKPIYKDTLLGFKELTLQKMKERTKS